MKPFNPNNWHIDIKPAEISIGQRKVGGGHPAYIVAEVGINHNGSLQTALALVDAAVEAGCDAVKFQKRFPDQCVPRTQRDVIRETPWGKMSYLEYRHRVEFSIDEYDSIDSHCKQKGISWFASCWDEASVDFIKRYAPDCYKVASASLTAYPLLESICAQGKPVILSTGMSTMDEIRKAISIFDRRSLVIVHTTSDYNGDPAKLNLKVINRFKQEFDLVVGYSGHEKGITPTLAAVALGASYVERHITLDRSMWGSDQAISLEPHELQTMVDHIRLVEQAMGDGVKRVYESEKRVQARLRNHVNRMCEGHQK
ncbi:sialic acid synthase [Desulfosarcina widdelii]|uniref:Sialic acid synthase n=1 Tax=Desulfosarcina widdelii TaxID=947919 RepID=A0A5K7YWP7_9BACT|nr:N-acetylneuraminate synthase family protein [Desulfosarcina widdelii]BBO73756.1 sialic acid synthase [Desulfosarcina widdelii]